nr:hypothetical protein [Tanacetum cinerariifolium]
MYPLDRFLILASGTSTRNENNNTSDGLAAIQAQLNNLGMEIKKVNKRVYVAQVGYELCGNHVKSISIADEADIPSIRRIKPTRYTISSQQKDDKIQSIKLSQAIVLFPGRLKEYDKEEVLKGLKKLQVNSAETATSLKKLMKEKTRIKEEIKTTINEHYSAIIKDDLPLKEKNPRERMELDLEARLMGEALILKRSQDLEFGYFLELNDLNKPLELRNHDNKDLDPEIKEEDIIDELMVDVVKIRIAVVEARRFDEFNTISDVNDSVTYQMGH